ncbi:hypothetical protein DSD19_16540 [Rhodovulum sp. BSW8]|nr:hypothetical protein BV509_16340 [Rhodovulum sulfidophilum]RBO52103.1 hypothetical protein DSD19_16540 [Rhodovulum sp. BSW8]
MARRQGRAKPGPGVQADMVVIAASGTKRRAGPVALLQLEPRQARTEGNAKVQIGHLQMDMADASFCDMGHLR